MKEYSCNRRGNARFYRIRRGKKRCSGCGFEFTPWPAKGFRLKTKDWQKIIERLLLERSGQWISGRLSLGKNQACQGLLKIRQALARDVPDIFTETVEVDETYLGGQKKNKTKQQLWKEKQIFGKESKRGFGTAKQPVFGILCRNGRVFAKLADNTQAEDLIPIITKRVKPGTRICSDAYRSHTGLAAKGYVRRTVEHGAKEYVRGKNHINGLEGFWGYLKRKSAAKGGVRRKYLGLFLGEYVWRHNHRDLDAKQQIKRTIGLLKSSG